MPDLATLVAAVLAFDLVLQVFAATNDGFAKLSSGVVDNLMKAENKDQLVDILTYHVLASQVFSKDLKSFQRVKTVEGQNLHVYKSRRGAVQVTPNGKDKKTVTTADVAATNGVVHIIDGVLLPPAVPATTAAPTLPNIVELAESVPDG